MVLELWDLWLDVVVLVMGIVKLCNLMVMDLCNSIEYCKCNGLDVCDYEDIYWSCWFYLLNVLVLCLVVVLFVFGLLCSGGMGKCLFFGILFVLGFWLL